MAPNRCAMHVCHGVIVFYFMIALMTHVPIVHMAVSREIIFDRGEGPATGCPVYI